MQLVNVTKLVRHYNSCLVFSLFEASQRVAAKVAAGTARIIFDFWRQKWPTNIYLGRIDRYSARAWLERAALIESSQRN